MAMSPHKSITGRLTLKAFGLSDVGRKRTENQDSLCVDNDHMLFVVADGMGGHAAGEVASATAIETLGEFVAQVQTSGDEVRWPDEAPDTLTYHERTLTAGIHLANGKITRMSADNPEMFGMGSTIVALYAPDEHIYIAHVGDSRIYRRRDAQLSLLTDDHSWVNEQLQRKVITEEEARHHRWRNVITRALGQQGELQVDTARIDPLRGDLFLMCSDGLTGMIDDAQINLILGRNKGDLEAACRELIAAANKAGGNDNISVLLVQVVIAPPY